MLTLRVQATGFPAAMRQIEGIKSLVQEKKDDIAAAALNGAAVVFERNFQSEGLMAGGWAALAESTIAERVRKGFGGEHPILIRYGDLKRIAVDSLMTAGPSSTFAKTDADGKSIEVHVQTTNGKLIVTQAGEKAVNQSGGGDVPARPYWFVSAEVQSRAREGAVTKLANEIEKVIR